MVKVSQNLWKESYHNILFQVDLGLCGSEVAIAVFCLVKLGSNLVVGEDLFLIGMIFKLPLGSTYPNTVQGLHDFFKL